VIVSAARKWLARPGRTIVHVFSRSFYGYEFLMHSLAKEFKCKIHVTEEQLVRYEHLPNTRAILTADSTVTRIHFCQVQRDDYTGTLPCTVALDVLTIIPSAMYFTKVVRITYADVMVLLRSAVSYLETIFQTLFRKRPSQCQILQEPLQ
jgi:hypothetical protein